MSAVADRVDARAAGRVSEAPLVLVEPLAAGAGGHWSKALLLLAEAAARGGRRCVVVAARGIDPGLRAELERVGAEVVCGESHPLLVAGNLLHRAFDVLQPRLPGRPLAYQLRHLARALVEAASLRMAPRGTVVLPTANDTLPALTATLSGVSHLRFVHEVCEYECRTIRVIERMLRRRLRRVRALCPTEAVASELRARYPSLEVQVQTFALVDRRNGDRAAARSRLALAPRATVGSLIGGWWQVKDHETVLEALRLARVPFTLLIAGHRLDRRVLEAIREAHPGIVRVIDRELSPDELRDVFAASDFTIVSRKPNGKESGVALDAIANGVPVVISDRDGGLSDRLRGSEWARVFSCGDPASLARALADAAGGRLEHPPAKAPTELGMLRPEQMLEVLDAAVPTRG